MLPEGKSLQAKEEDKNIFSVIFHEGFNFTVKKKNKKSPKYCLHEYWLGWTQAEELV